MPSEVGHARNVQRFEELVAFVTSWGASYQPSNAEIELSKLNNKLSDCQTAIDVVSTSLADTKTARNDRENVFKGLRKLTTRVVNFYASTSPDENDLDSAKSLKRKIDGKRAEQVEDDPDTPDDESANTISASQQSYTQLVEHLDNLIELLSNDASYNPNENDLKIVTLTTLSTNMKAANTNVINNVVTLSNSRGDRDFKMYEKESGLVDKAMLVKKYVKAAFGTDSMEYNQIKGLEFSRPN